MDKKSITKLLPLLLIVFMGVILTAAQDDDTARSLTSNDFEKPGTVKKRSSTKVNAKKTPLKKYKYVSVSSLPSAPKRGSKSVRLVVPAKSGPAKLAEIGVTIWRLRQPGAGENGFLLPVNTGGREPEMWASDRVGPETLFRVGDRIRFAIESSVSGYLYIFSREMRSDGTLGPPDMHFPETEGEDNFIVPNLMFDFPDRRDRTPYRKFGALEKNYVGDIVTVIVSPKPLSGLVRAPDGKLNRPDILSELESGSEVELFARPDNEDRVYTKSEADAACGQKTRGLEKEKPNVPCGENARQLTKDDPYPQSIYRIKSYAGKPAVAFVKLAVK